MPIRKLKKYLTLLLTVALISKRMVKVNINMNPILLMKNLLIYELNGVDLNN